MAGESECFPLRSPDGLVETHKSSCRMAVAVAGTLEVAAAAGGTHNALIPTAALTVGSGAQPCEVVVDVHPHMGRFGSCCCKKRRLQSCILAAEGTGTLGFRSDRGYLGGMMKVSVLEKAS